MELRYRYDGGEWETCRLAACEMRRQTARGVYVTNNRVMIG